MMVAVRRLEVVTDIDTLTLHLLSLSVISTVALEGLTVTPGKVVMTVPVGDARNPLTVTVKSSVGSTRLSLNMVTSAHTRLMVGVKRTLSSTGLKSPVALLGPTVRV